MLSVEWWPNDAEECWLRKVRRIVRRKSARRRRLSGWRMKIWGWGSFCSNSGFRYMSADVGEEFVAAWGRWGDRRYKIDPRQVRRGRQIVWLNFYDDSDLCRNVSCVSMTCLCCTFTTKRRAWTACSTSVELLTLDIFRSLQCSVQSMSMFQCSVVSRTSIV